MEFPNNADWGGVVDIWDDCAVTGAVQAGEMSRQQPLAVQPWAVQGTELGQK